jgi:hypothetical protein
MKVSFDSKLYTEGAIKKAYNEFLNKDAPQIKKSGGELIIELPSNIKKEDVCEFESMALLFTIEEKRR